MEMDLRDGGSDTDGGERRGWGTPGSSPKHRMVAVVMGAPGTVKEKGVPFSGRWWAGPGHGSL